MIDTLQCKCMGFRAIAPSIGRQRQGTEANNKRNTEREHANKILVENKTKDTLDFLELWL